MLRLSRRTRIWPQRDVIKYIRSAIAIDGLIRQFAPGFNVGDHLGTACRRYLTGQARRALFSHDAVVNWSRASVNLFRHGAFRFANFLERVAEARAAAPAPARRHAHASDESGQATQLGLMAVGIFALAFLTNPSFELGLNLFTAQLTCGALALLAFLRNRHGASIAAGST